jgi:CRISPR-associated endoribonuclease Cas6
MRIKLTLVPAAKTVTLPISYNYFLTSLIYRFIHNSSRDYSHFLHDEGYRLGDSKKGFKLFTYSMLQSEKVEVNWDRISFGKEPVTWQIASPVDAFVQHLVTGVFAEGQEIKIGPEGQEVRFLIENVENLPRPEFRESMRFTCLSSITVSRLSESHCHYIRPGEEGLSEAIKNNLVKKYRLVHGKEIENAGLRVNIDEDYMKRKNGKITKNINFKGTNIIGFMAPFEVVGDLDLIKIGYESGFGEKGSMGFGMVKEIV